MHSSAEGKLFWLLLLMLALGAALGVSFNRWFSSSWLALAAVLLPGTLVALRNAMLRQVIADGLVDEAYLAARTTGWDAVRAAVQEYTPEVAERITGVPAERIVAAARLYWRAPTSHGWRVSSGRASN